MCNCSSAEEGAEQHGSLIFHTSLKLGWKRRAGCLSAPLLWGSVRAGEIEELTQRLQNHDTASPTSATNLLKQNIDPSLPTQGVFSILNLIDSKYKTLFNAFFFAVYDWFGMSLFPCSYYLKCVFNERALKCKSSVSEQVHVTWGNLNLELKLRAYITIRRCGIGCLWMCARDISALIAVQNVSGAELLMVSSPLSLTLCASFSVSFCLPASGSVR